MFGGKGGKKQVPLGLVFRFWGGRVQKTSPLELVFSPPARVYPVFVHFLKFLTVALLFSLSPRSLKSGFCITVVLTAALAKTSATADGPFRKSPRSEGDAQPDLQDDSMSAGGATLISLSGGKLTQPRATLSRQNGAARSRPEVFTACSFVCLLFGQRPFLIGATDCW